MSESTAVANKKKATKAVDANATKSAPAKKATKKAVKTTSVREKPLEHGIERSRDLPWSAKKVALFKALKALKAVDAVAAKSATDIVAKANASASAGVELTTKDVRHYGYHAKAGGLIDVVDGEEFRGYGFYLTKKGVAIDPVGELKAQEKAKAAKAVKKPAAE